MVIGVARLKPTERPTTAELAPIVEDAWQRIGLGAILVAHILQAGEQRGIDDFRADVLTTNDAMLHPARPSHGRHAAERAAA